MRERTTAPRIRVVRGGKNNGKPATDDKPWMAIEIPPGSTWDEGDCMLHVNGRQVCAGGSRDCLVEAFDLGLQAVGRYFVRDRNSGKELEIQLLTRAQRAAGVKALVAVRNLEETIS